MSDAKKQLLQILKERAFKRGTFQLASGGVSDYYIDGRMAEVYSEAAYQIGETLYEHTKDLQFDAIGGLVVGAVPLTTAAVISYHLHGKKMEGFWVRDKAKTHGMQKLVEGNLTPGARVVIVDDVCTTGASTVQAIEAAREFGFDVVGAMCLVEREEAGGRPSVETAASPAPFVSIFTAKDVRKEHVLQTDETNEFAAISTTCELCGQPAVTHHPRSRCKEHKI